MQRAEPFVRNCQINKFTNFLVAIVTCLRQRYNNNNKQIVTIKGNSNNKNKNNSHLYLVTIWKGAHAHIHMYVHTYMKVCPCSCLCVCCCSNSAENQINLTHLMHFVHFLLLNFLQCISVCSSAICTYVHVYVCLCLAALEYAAILELNSCRCS